MKPGGSEGLCLVLDVWDPERGGLERYAEELARELVARGARLRIVCDRARCAGPETSELVELGASGPAFYREVDRRAERGELGVQLSFRHPGRSARFFLPLGGLLRSSLDARRQSESWLERWPRGLARKISGKTRAYLGRERAFFEAPEETRLVLASSDLVQSEIRNRFPGFPGRIEVCGLPVDERRFRPPDPEERAVLRRSLFGVQGEEPCLLWVGNDPKRKGLAEARKVLRRLRWRKLDARLVLAGHRSERFDAVEPGLMGLGYVEPEPLYRASDVLVAPSLEDNLSFSVLEALASGLPVVTTERNGASSFIQDPAVGRVIGDSGAVHELDGAVLAMLERGLLEEGPRLARRQAVATCFRKKHFERVLDAILEDR
ncbi:MAG: glycosyltransferase family 4 protein [Planctomycetota bacterium]